MMRRRTFLKCAMVAAIPAWMVRPRTDDLSLSLAEYSDKYLKPAMESLAASMDLAVANGITPEFQIGTLDITIS